MASYQIDCFALNQRRDGLVRALLALSYSILRRGGTFCCLVGLITSVLLVSGCSSKSPPPNAPVQAPPVQQPAADQAAPANAQSAPNTAPPPAAAPPIAANSALPSPVNPAPNVPVAATPKEAIQSKYQVDFSRDGHLAVSGGKNATVRLFDIDKGVLVRTFTGQKEPVSAIAFRQDAAMIAAGSVEGRLMIWDSRTADGLDETERATLGSEERIPLYGHEGPIHSLAFRSDGREIASGGEDGTIRFWKLPISYPEVIWSPNNSVTMIKAVPQSSTILAGRSDGVVELCELADSSTVTLLAETSNAITALAVSEDGKFAAAGDRAGNVRVVDLESQKPFFEQAAHEGEVTGLRFHPKRSQLISIGTDGTTRSFDVGPNSSSSNQTVLHTVQSKGRIMSVSHSGNYAAIAGGNVVEVADLKNRKQLHSLPIDGGEVVSVAWSSEDRTLVAGTANGEIHSWRIPSGQKLFESRIQEGAVRALAGSAQDSKVASGGADGKIRLWNPLGIPEVMSDTGKLEATRIAASPNGLRIAVGMADGSMRIVDTEKKASSTIYPPAGKAISSIAWSADGELLAATGGDSLLRIWNVQQGVGSLVTLETGAPISQITFHSTGPTLIATLQNGEFQKWKLPFQKSQSLAGHEEAINAVIANESGSQIFTAGNDRICRLFNLSGSESIRSFEGSQDAITCLTRSSEGTWIAAGDRSGQISMWSSDNANVLGVVQTIDGAVTAMDYLPSKKLLASASIDGLVRIWRTPFATPIQMTDANQETAVVSISPNGKRIALGRDDHSIVVRDARTGEQIQTFSGHAGKVTALGWSIDSSLVVSGSADETVGLWRISDGQRVVKWEGHTVAPRAVAISANGEEIRVCSEDGRLAVFTRATTKERVLLPSQTSVSALAMSPSGKRLAIAAVDGSVQLVNCENGTVLGATPAVDSIVALAWCADDVTWISIDSSRNVKYWKQLTVESSHGWSNAPKGLTKFCVSSDGSHVLTTTEEGPPKLWDADGHLLQNLAWNSKSSVRAIALSDDGQLAVAMGSDGVSIVYPSLPIQAIAAHSGHVDSVKFSSDKSIVTAGDDQTIRAFNLTDGSEIRKFDGCPAKVIELAVSTVLSKLIALADDKKIYFWNLADGTPLAVPAEFTERAYRRFGLNADGKRIAALDDQGKFRILELDGLTEIGEMASPTTEASSIAYLKDGTVISAAESLAFIIHGNTVNSGFKAHDGSATGVVAVPSRDEFVTAGEDGKIKLWSIEGEPVRQIAELDSPIQSIAINNSGKELAVQGKDNKVTMWNLDGESTGSLPAGNRIKSFQYSTQSSQSIVTTSESQIRMYAGDKGKAALTLNSQGKFTASTVTSDRRVLYATTNDGNLVRYWIEPIKVIDSEQRDVLSLAISRNGGSLASGGEDSTVAVWKLPTFKLTNRLKGHSKPVNLVVFGRDESTVISSSLDKSIRTWNVPGAKSLQTIPVSAPAQTLSVSVDGKNLAVANRDKAVSVFEIQSGKPNQSVSTESSSVLAAFYSSKGIMTFDADKRISVTDSTTAKQFPKQEGSLTGLEVFRDGSFLVTAGVKTGIKLFDFNGKMVGEFDTSKGVIGSVSCSSDGLWLAGFNSDGVGAADLTIWNVASRKIARTIPTPSPIRTAQFEPDGETVLIVGEDRQLRRYRTIDGVSLESIPMNDEVRGELTFHSAGEILSLERDDRVRLYQPALTRLQQAHKGPVTGLAYSTNGNLLFSGGNDGRVASWDDKAATPVVEFQVDNVAVNNIQLLANQQSLIATYSDNVVRVWSLARKSNEPESAFVHKAPVKCIWTSGDSTLMATGGMDKIVHLWLLSTGRELVQFRGHEAAVSRVVIATDNKSVVSFGDEDSIRVWKVPEDALTASATGHVDRSTGTVAVTQPQDAEIDRLMKGINATGTNSSNAEDLLRLENLRSGRAPNSVQPGVQAEVGSQKIDRDIQSIEKRIRNAVGQNKKKLTRELTILKLQKQVANSTGSKQVDAKKELEDYQSGKTSHPSIDLELERQPGIDPALRSIRTDFNFEAENHRPIKLALSPDKSAIGIARESALTVTGPVPGVVQIWDRESGSLLRSWKENQLPKVSSILFSSNEKVLFTFPELFTFQIQTGVSQLLASNACLAINRAEGSNLIAIGLATSVKSQMPVLKFFDAGDMSYRPQAVTGYEAKITAMTFSPDGKSLFYCERGSRQHKLFEMDSDNTSKTVLIEEFEHSEPWHRMSSDGIGIEALCMTRDGKNLIAYGQYGNADYRLVMWTRSGDKWAPNNKLSIKSNLPLLRNSEGFRMWTIKDRASVLCVEDNNGTVQTLDLATGKPIGQRGIRPNRWGKPESSHSDDGIWFVWGDDTGKFEVWDMRDLKQPPRTVKAHQGPIVGITISADGSASGDFIVTVSEENLIKVWELPKKAEPAKKPRPKK